MLHRTRRVLICVAVPLIGLAGPFDAVAQERWPAPLGAGRSVILDRQFGVELGYVDDSPCWGVAPSLAFSPFSFAYSPYRWYGRGYGYYSPWRYARPLLTYPVPPVVVPAEEMFGPAALARFLDVDPLPAPPLLPLRIDVDEAVADLPAGGRDKARVSNDAARERAGRFMEHGDRHFARGDYLQAYERYKLAVQAAPDVVEAYLRRGQVLVALGNYKLAAQTFTHAFKMHPAWARTDFRLDRIYGDRRHAKTTHLDALAAAAEQQPTAELMLLIAAQLYYDGQAERSLKFFERAKELHGGAEVERPPLEAAEADGPPPVAAPQQNAKRPNPAAF